MRITQYYQNFVIVQDGVKDPPLHIFDNLCYYRVSGIGSNDMLVRVVARYIKDYTSFWGWVRYEINKVCE